MEISSKTTIIINQMTMISLGEVTIPYYNGLSHSWRFVFPKFTVLKIRIVSLPEKPHIHIRAYIESSPPVLDIKDGVDRELRSCIRVKGAGRAVN